MPNYKLTDKTIINSYPKINSLKVTKIINQQSLSLSLSLSQVHTPESSRSNLCNKIYEAAWSYFYFNLFWNEHIKYMRFSPQKKEKKKYVLQVRIWNVEYTAGKS